MKNLIPFLVIALAVVIANNLFPDKTISKEAINQLTPEAAPPAHKGCGGCGAH